MAKRMICECHREVRLPERFEEAMEFDWGGLARDALTSVMPETDMATSSRYLARARFALFLSRAIEAIKKGSLGSQRRQINQLLRCTGVLPESELEVAKERAVRCSTDRETLNRNVQMVKVAYSLREAEKSLPPSR